jgi:hypothetical protein
MDAEDTGPKQRGVPFKPGQSGNPAGRPKGARNRLSEDFLRVLADDFAENGVEAIEAARVESPSRYMAIIASLMPKQVELQTSPVEQLTDDELEQLIAHVRQLAAVSANPRGRQSPSSSTH